nr:hypothetical protein [Tanacetum cinerariifolium]
EGRVVQGHYETSARLSSLGVIGGDDITSEAAITKLMFVLGLELGEGERELGRLGRVYIANKYVAGVGPAVEAAGKVLVQVRLAALNGAQAAGAAGGRAGARLGRIQGKAAEVVAHIILVEQRDFYLA